MTQPSHPTRPAPPTLPSPSTTPPLPWWVAAVVLPGAALTAAGA
jgi:hypothetical protein